MKRTLRSIINELAIDNCNHLAIHKLNFPLIETGIDIFGLATLDDRVIPVISLTVMTVCTIMGIEGDIDFDQEVDWSGK